MIDNGYVRNLSGSAKSCIPSAIRSIHFVHVDKNRSTLQAPRRGAPGQDAGLFLRPAALPRRRDRALPGGAAVTPQRHAGNRRFCRICDGRLRATATGYRMNSVAASDPPYGHVLYWLCETDYRALEAAIEEAKHFQRARTTRTAR